VNEPGAVRKRVYLFTADLLFRSKLGAVVAAAGGEVTRDEAGCDLAVVDLADGARAARDAGARAVPNSEVAAALRNLLQ
jgi:hypothetical protein